MVKGFLRWLSPAYGLARTWHDEKAKSSKQARKTAKAYAKYEKQSMKLYPGLKGKKSKKMEKEGYKALLKAQKGKHVKFNRLFPGQREIERKLSKTSLKDLKSQKPLKDIHLPTHTEAYKKGNEFLKDMLSGKTTAYEGMRKNAMDKFNRETVPAITERFGAMGAGGTQSSAFRDALAQAAAMVNQEAANNEQMMIRNDQKEAVGPALTYSQMPLQEQASLRGLGQNQQSQLLGIDKYMQGYIPPVLPGQGQMPGFMQQPQNPGTLHSFANALGPPLATGVGMGAGYAIGGPVGAGIMGGLGKMMGSDTGGGGGGNAQMPALAQGFGQRLPAFNPSMYARMQGF